MVAYAVALSDNRSDSIPIETMRGIAVVLLVSYHVIGPGKGSGLDITYPHMLRFYADFFIDLRMPFFAFIAGYLYALRPISVKSYPQFMIGKLRRLALPGGVAVLLFALVANLLGNKFALPWSEMLHTLSYSYAHFWFLQSVLVLFVVFGLVDVLLSQRFTVGILMLACVGYLSGFAFNTSFFSVNGTIYLLPYFLVGVVFFRHANEIWEEAERITIVALIICVTCAFWNIRVLYDTDTFSLVRRDVQSLGFGLSMCLLAVLWCPKLTLLEKLSPYAFTIYLYHIFGTVAARMMCNAFDISQTDIRFFIGLAGGLLLPIMMHEVVLKSQVLSVTLLGRCHIARKGLGAP